MAEAPTRSGCARTLARRRDFIAVLGGAGLLWSVKARRARAQQPATPVFGLLTSLRSTDQALRARPSQKVLLNSTMSMAAKSQSNFAMPTASSNGSRHWRLIWYADNPQ